MRTAADRPAPGFRLEKVTFGYDRRDVLHGLDAEVEAGRLTALLGPNGSGKSTLLHLLAGVETPRRGAVRLGDEPVHALTAHERARTIALVPQRHAMTFPFSVTEVVLMGRSPYVERFRVPGRDDWEAVERALAAFDLHPLRDAPVTELSGGEAKRVALALAVAQATPVLLLDEPTSSLDIRHALDLMALLRRFAKEEERTVVFVMHDVDLAASVAERCLFLRNGAVAAAGETAATVTPETLRSVFDVPCEVHVEGGRPHIRYGLAQVDAEARGERSAP